MYRNRGTRTPVDAIRELTEAWLRKDEPGMSRCLTDDIAEIGPAFAGALLGKRAFFRKYKAYFEGPLEILSYRMLRPRTIELSPDLVLVYFEYRMKTRERGRRRVSTGKESILLVRQRSRWRIRFIHWHRDPARKAAK